MAEEAPVSPRRAQSDSTGDISIAVHVVVTDDCGGAVTRPRRERRRMLRVPLSRLAAVSVWELLFSHALLEDSRKYMLYAGATADSIDPEVDAPVHRDTKLSCLGAVPSVPDAAGDGPAIVIMCIKRSARRSRQDLSG